MEQRTVKKVAYHLQVYTLLKQDILSGRIAAGMRINEYNLAKEASAAARYAKRYACWNAMACWCLAATAQW